MFKKSSFIFACLMIPALLFGCSQSVRSKIGTLTFSPAAGTYPTAQTVTISCPTAGVTIRYTTDGTNPSASIGTVYSSPIAISATTTLSAIATKTDFDDSDIARAIYIISPTVETGGVEYYPHTDGYRWNYTYTPPGSPTSGNMAREFNGTQTFNSIACQKFVWTQDFAASSEILANVTSSDVKFYGTSSSPTTDATTWLSFPLQVGKTWTIYGSYTASVEAFESITVPTGTYNAFKVFYDYGVPGARYYYWYAKDVGAVAFEIYWVTQNITATLSSKNF